MKENADIESAKELVQLCRAGRLYDIERCAADGKSLDVSATVNRGRQKSLLKFAVDTEFHSMVELKSPLRSMPYPAMARRSGNHLSGLKTTSGSFSGQSGLEMQV
jgi:hypothetical protein